jgi:hypothetical protein
LQARNPGLQPHLTEIRTFLPSGTGRGPGLRRARAAAAAGRSAPTPLAAAERPAAPPAPTPRPATPTMPQRNLLRALAERGVASVSELRSVCGNLQQVLAHCVAHGWAMSWKDPTTGSQVARLTDAGQAVLDALSAREAASGS